jgi:hypothetical protein
VTDGTFLDALVSALDTARRATGGGGQARAAALLWPDESRDWEPIAELVATRLPLMTLGRYNGDGRRGPAYWIRCVVDGSIPLEGFDDEAPVIYLPGYGKTQLRAVEEAPPEIQPIAELQYRGAVFSQQNGKDWTIPAFMQSSTHGGLGLEVAADNSTRAAIRQARAQLTSVRISRLRSAAPLRAAFFEDLLAPDLPRLVLEWLDDPLAFKSSCPDAEWAAFCERFRHVYRLDVVEAGPLKVAEYLGERQDDVWDVVWRRFMEAPGLYGHIPDRLRAARPTPSKKGEGLFDRIDAWPQINEEAEAELRGSLQSLRGQAPNEARVRLGELEQQHHERRAWVWARLGRSPLAEALAHLNALAKSTARLPVGATVNEIAIDFASTGWIADDAAMRALAEVSNADDVGAVESAIVAVYGEWLDQSATAFQKAAAVSYEAEPSPDWPPGTCVIFSDGLRYDVGKRLATALADRGLTIDLKTRLAALPTVTNTGKPYASPARARLGPGPGMDPAVVDGPARVTIDVLRKELNAVGYEVLGAGDLGDPTGRAWAELGDVDSLGHDQTSKLPRLLDGEVASLVERIRGLLAHGWQQVAVVTDHGWLYLPGGLPKVDLPLHLTVGGANKKARCGRLEEGAVTAMQTVPWTWDSTVSMAIPPGSSAFQAGQVYEHGGLSPQECVTPLIVVRGAVGQTAPSASMSISVLWRGLRSVATVSGAPIGASVDMRRKAGDPSTSVASHVARLGSDRTAKLLVEDEDLIGTPAFVVVLDTAGTVIGQQMIEIGADA